MPALHAEVPYAYVVEQRPLDACAPPDCTIRSRNVVGWWDQVQADGHRGSYIRYGAPDSETYFRRAWISGPGRTYEVALPATEAESEYDGYFAAVEGTDWKADFDVVLPDGAVVLHQSLHGTSSPVEAKETAEMGRYDDHLSHVRIRLPTRSTQRQTIRIRNVGATALAIGSPLIVRKVIGRKPRQAFFVFFDGVPEPLFTRMFSGSGDAQTEWLATALRERGTVFSHGMAPGFNTPTFTRRFFRSGFYETAGEPVLYGQGFDDEPPDSPPSAVARLAEQGFQTELTTANFLLMPSQSRLGFDGGYQNELQVPGKMHPPALVRRFKDWLAEHPHDDAFNVVWFSTTHEPFPPGRPSPPFLLNAPGLSYSHAVLDPVWRNLLAAVDSLGELLESATRLAPDANRLWLLATDHGLTYTTRSIEQPTWLPPNRLIVRGSWHCCLASFEETNTPFAVLYDGSERVTAARVDEPTSTSAVWRLLERLYGVRLGLPDTRTFDSVAIDPESHARRWDDELLAGAGDSGSIRATRHGWAYRSLAIHPTTANAWSASVAVQRMLTGSPNRGASFLAEELYDRGADPFELENQADAHPEVVLDFRRKLADWLATYFDPPTHPRYEYTLHFPGPVTLTLNGPRPFFVGADGQTPSRTAARAATLGGSQFVVREDEGPTTVLDVSGATPGAILRCGATGLPLQVFAAGPTRVNLAVARTNCVTTATERPPGATDIAFTARLVKARALATGGLSSDDLIDGLRRWGYVRDLDRPKAP
jgi:hypothetical protein